MQIGIGKLGMFMDKTEKRFQINTKERLQNINRLMKECIEDKRRIMAGKGLKYYQTDLINITISLFEKREPHSVYWKESKAKEKGDKVG